MCDCKDWRDTVSMTKRAKAWSTTRRPAATARIIERAMTEHGHELLDRGWRLMPETEVTTVYLGLFLTTRCFRNGQVLTVLDLDEQR